MNKNSNIKYISTNKTEEIYDDYEDNKNQLKESYENILLVNSSVNLLFTYLIKNLCYISNNYTNSLSEWANNILEGRQIATYRITLKNILLETISSSPNSATTYAGKGYIRYDKNNNPYPYSIWFSSKNYILSDIEKLNNILLKDADILEILYHLCCLFDKLINRFNNAFTISANDLDNLEVITKISDYFKKLYLECKEEYIKCSKSLSISVKNESFIKKN